MPSGLVEKVGAIHSDLEEMRKAGRLDVEAVREILVDALGEGDERVRALDRLAETGRAFRP